MWQGLRDDGTTLTFARSYFGDGVRLLALAAVGLLLLEATTPENGLLRALGVPWRRLPEDLRWVGVFVLWARGKGLYHVLAGAAALAALLCVTTRRGVSFDRGRQLLSSWSRSLLWTHHLYLERKDVVRLLFVRQRESRFSYRGVHLGQLTWSSRGAYVGSGERETGVLRAELGDGDVRDLIDLSEHHDLSQAGLALAAAMGVPCDLLAHHQETRTL